MPRFDQSFNGLCEQNNLDTLQLKQRFLDQKAKRPAKPKDKKQQDTIQSSVHVQQKFLKRSAEEHDPGGQNNDCFEPPVKLQCTTQHGSHQPEGLTKFSVEIVQQLEFTTSAANSQPQQISTNVTVKAHTNASVKSDVASPKSNPSTPANAKNMGGSVDVNNLVECVKQEPNNDFADLAECAAAVEKDAANGGMGFGAITDLIGEDTNDEIFTSNAFKELISDISSCPEFNFDFEDKHEPDLKVEDLKDIPMDVKATHSPLLQNQNYSPPVFETTKNRIPPYSNMDFSKTELSPAAQTLKQMAEQHQHKNQMGLSFNPNNRAPNSRSPYPDFQLPDYGSPNSNSNFHKNSPSFPQPDMIKQEMIFQGSDFDMKRKSGIYKQQYSPYGSPSPGSHGSPGYLPRSGNSSGNNAGQGSAGGNGGTYSGATPPRPPSGPGPGGNTGTTLQINQAQSMHINQQGHGHNIQVSAGQHLHLSGDLKGGSVSIATQQGMHFQHQTSTNSTSQSQNEPNQPTNPMSSQQPQQQQQQQPQQQQQQQPQSASQNNTVPGGGTQSQQQQQQQHSSSMLSDNHPSMHQSSMSGNSMPSSNMSASMGSMSGGNTMQGNPGGMPTGPMSSNPGMAQGNPGMANMGGNMAGGGIMGGGMNAHQGGMPGSQHMGGQGQMGDTYSMTQSQTINFTQQTLRQRTNTGVPNPMGGGPVGMGGQMGGPPMGPNTMRHTMSPMEQQKMMQQQQMLRTHQVAMQQQQQQPMLLRPPPPDYKSSAGMIQGMGPRYAGPGGAPANMRRMPHQSMPPSGPMMRPHNMYMMQQQQHIASRGMYTRQQTPGMGGMEGMPQHGSAEWRHMMMAQQQGSNFTPQMRPSYHNQGFGINSGGLQMQPMQQPQMRGQHGSLGGMGQGQMMNQQGQMAQMSTMNQQMLMQQQQSVVQGNSQMSMTNIHMQQSQTLTVGGQGGMQQQPQPNMNGQQQLVTQGGGGQQQSAPMSSQGNEIFDMLGIQPDGALSEQELLNTFASDSGFNLNDISF